MSTQIEQRHVTFAAVVLTLNEEVCIRRCLDSLSWCNERLVVDSGSIDRTTPTAQDTGAKVVVNKQGGVFDIAKQRNWALENGNLTSDWIIFVDADEVVGDDLRKELIHVCGQPNCVYDAFELAPRFLFYGQWLKRTQGFPNWHARVVRRGKGKFVGGVWEHFDEGISIGRIATPYEHYAFSKGMVEWLDRHNRYSSWEARIVVQYLADGDARALETSRSAAIRVWAARFWPFRCIVRPLHTYLFRGGWTEGIAGFIYAWLYFVYEFMITVKIIELLSHKNKKGMSFKRTLSSYITLYWRGR